MPTSTSRSRPQLTAASWMAAAVEVIVEEGVAAVAVERLAARLGATKGSFYHHFASREALLQAVLDDWEQSQTEDVIARLGLLPDPADRLRAVMAAAIADLPGGRRDAALLASATDPLVRRVVQRVTARRIGYFTDRYVELGMPPERARHRAHLLYFAYLGLFHSLRARVEPDLVGGDLSAYAAELLETLVPDGRG